MLNMSNHPQLSRRLFQSEAHRLPDTRSRRTRATTLVEVMVAAIIFTITAISIGTLFLNNNKMSMRLRYRTNATNVALNILEQIRVLNYANLNDVYANSAPTSVTSPYIRVIIADPNAPDYSALALPDPTSLTHPGIGVKDTSGASPGPAVPAKFQYIDVTINVRDGVEKNTTWTTFPNGGLPLSTSSTGSRMPMNLWLTLKYNPTVSGDATMPAAGEVFEIVLVYQWQQPGQAEWNSGTVRTVVPNPGPAVIRS